MQHEADSIAREIDKRRKAGTSPGEIGVFYTAPFVATEVMASLTRAGIPFEWLKDPNAMQWQPGHESVKLMTLHSSKGLQYQVGIIAGAGCLPWRSPAEDARLMYVAMTRATHELLITGSRRTVFTERLREVCGVEAA